jgi:hypothetical protein
MLRQLQQWPGRPSFRVLSGFKCIADSWGGLQRRTYMHQRPVNIPRRMLNIHLARSGLWPELSAGSLRTQQSLQA